MSTPGRRHLSVAGEQEAERHRAEPIEAVSTVGADVEQLLANIRAITAALDVAELNAREPKRPVLRLIQGGRRD